MRERRLYKHHYDRTEKASLDSEIRTVCLGSAQVSESEHALSCSLRWRFCDSADRIGSNKTCPFWSFLTDSLSQIEKGNGFAGNFRRHSDWHF
jgi:hypothetical protein